MFRDFSLFALKIEGLKFLCSGIAVSGFRVSRAQGVRFWSLHDCCCSCPTHSATNRLSILSSSW